MRSKELPEELRDRIVARHRSGQGYKKNSAALKVPKSTVAFIILKWKTFGTTRTLPRAGRPAKLSYRGRRALVREVKKNPEITVAELQRCSREMGESCRKSTITAALHQSGLYGRVARRKPLLSARHMKARMEFAKKTPEGLQDVPTVKHGGGSIMLWGCFSAAGTGRLVAIEGKMNAATYRDILDETFSRVLRTSDWAKGTTHFNGYWLRRLPIIIIPCDVMVSAANTICRQYFKILCVLVEIDRALVGVTRRRSYAELRSSVPLLAVHRAEHYQIVVNKQGLKRDIKSNIVLRLIELKVLPMSNTADGVDTGGVLSQSDVVVGHLSIGDEGPQSGTTDADAEGEPEAKAGLPPFDPFSPSSVGSREDARLKVRLARLQYEAQEKTQARQAEINLRLEVRRLEIEADKQVKLRQLDLEAMKVAAGPAAQPTLSQVSGAPPLVDSSPTTFDVTLEVCSTLSLEESLKYETVKSAILRAYELVPEAYRQKFRGHKKNSTQTFVEFAREKGILFDKWCTASKVNDLDSLRELVLLEEFKRCLPERVVVYLNEQKVASLSHAAVLADEFVLTHKSVFTSARSEKTQSVPFQPQSTRSKSSPPRPRENRECYYCHKFGHVVADCLALKRKQQPETKSVGFVKTFKPAVAVLCEERIDDSYRPFVLKALISLTGNSEDQKEIKMLRDTGAMQSFIVADKLQFSDETSCGSSVMVQGIEMGCVKVPLHRVHLQSELCTGFVRVAVRPSLPVKGVDFILGNDLAGGKIMPVLEVVDKPDVSCQSEDLSDSYPDVFPVCAVTRARSRKMGDAVDLSDSFILPLFADEKQLDDVVSEKQNDNVKSSKLAGKPNQVIPPAPLVPIPVIGEPFEHVIVDCVGPLPKTKSGNQYLLTIMCTATRFAEATPLRKITAPVIIKALVKFFSTFGLPKIVQSDQESQGCLERFHQTLKSMLRKYCLDTAKDWDEGVPLVLFAVRETVQESLGFSPAELVFGHQESLTNAQKDMKFRYDRKAVARSFMPGDQVLVLLPVLGSSLSARFYGPYVVKKKMSETDYMIITPDRKRQTRVCHINMLKAYHARESPLEKASEQTAGPAVSSIAVAVDLMSSPGSSCADEDGVVLRNAPQQCASDVPKLTTVLQHDIKVNGARPIKQHAYRVNTVKRSIMRQEVNYLLENGLAKHSYSPWSSPCLLVPKPDGTFRFCTDFRKVNAVTVPDSYPLPRMEDCVDNIGSACFVSKLDMLKGYWQVPLTPQASEISAFVTPDNFLQYTAMAFGLRNAPATFQRLVNLVLAGVPNCNAYLDDLVIYSADWTEHMRLLRTVFERLANANLTLNLAECEFGQATVTYLGKEVGQGQVRPVEAKVTAILEFPVPTARRELRRFLGMAGYYRSFCKNFSTIVSPLTALLSPSKSFDWSAECQYAFDCVKTCVMHLFFWLRTFLRILNLKSMRALLELGLFSFKRIEMV
ncbi:Retrovirus-related Pol polyprotein [Labeo rohita]|uniref:ribonuclease H n=1 Tax=Labeo rohita TaxID=84645 RepID=A0ABQ8MDM2_LABRO|nr:Retrovirus-related Pol polyprotein [Labeo rohita]